VRSRADAAHGVIAATALIGGLAAQAPWRVLDDATRPAAELEEVRTLRDAYHPWDPPATLADWHSEARELREQVLVSTGLWPMPDRPPLRPVIHGRIERDGYTVEKVFFASLPGHYVTGSLYRPTGARGKVPGVLCPHGHSANGRMHDAGDKKTRDQLDKGAETRPAAARHPLQACMVQLVRMGCVVFHHDMVGYASSRSIGHRSGFTDAAALLRSQSTLRLQTWNSIRALDFLLSLPEVDASRVGVTGHSGGGTQTFMLCAIDDRPAVAFPAVMVSTAMQGGCVCENAPYLRHGINNVALAALFAPRPLGLSGADDWTLEIETKGLPELQHVYGLLDARAHVTARCWPQFGHNYNQHAREMMYGWFNHHLSLELPTPVKEHDFVPLSRAELEVFDETHPLPPDAGDAAAVRAHWDAETRAALHARLPRDRGGVAQYQGFLRPAARVLLGDPARRGDSTTTDRGASTSGGLTFSKQLFQPATGYPIPAVRVTAGPTTRTVLWVDGGGKRALFDGGGDVIAPVRELAEAGAAVVLIDVLGTGELTPAGAPLAAPDRTYAGYTYCYNQPLIARRVQDIALALSQLSAEQVDLVGTGGAGPWALLALATAPRPVRHTLVDLRGFSFNAIAAADDPDLLPGALAFGGLGGLTALAAPARVTLVGTKGVPPEELRPLEVVSQLTGGALTIEERSPAREDIPALLR